MDDSFVVRIKNPLPLVSFENRVEAVGRGLPLCVCLWRTVCKLVILGRTGHRPCYRAGARFRRPDCPFRRCARFDAVDGERGDALALGFETLDADVTLGVDVKRIAKILGAAISDAQTGVGLAGEQDEARGWVVADEAGMAVARRAFEGEPLDVREALLVGVKKDGSPDCVRGEFFDA